MKRRNLIGHTLTHVGIFISFVAMLGCAHTEASRPGASFSPNPDHRDSDVMVSMDQLIASRPPQVLNHAPAFLKQAAEQGNAEAAFLLGQSYANGTGVAKDIDQAVFWYKKAADQGNVDARLNVRILFYLGEIVPGDIPDASEWWRNLVEQAAHEKQTFLRTAAAADRGNLDAVLQLGVDYLTGVGTKRNNALAKAEFQQAAQHKRLDAQCLFDILASVDDRPRQTVVQCSDAARQGSAVAQFAVSYMYRNARFGVPQDPNKMVDWERKAAEQGWVDAQYWLGRDYGAGYGVPRNNKMAVFWFRRALKQGSYAAMGLLSIQAFEAHDPRFVQFAFTDPLGKPGLAIKYSDLSDEHRADSMRDLIPNLFEPSRPRRWGLR